MSIYSKGFEVQTGWKKGAVWGTPVAVGVGNKIEFTSEGINKDVETVPVPEIAGMANFTDICPGLITAAGDMVMPLRYTGVQHSLIAMAFGSQTPPVIVGLGPTHTSEYVLTDSLEGLFGTLVFDKQAKIWEWKSCKVNGLTINFSVGGYAELSVPLICDDLDRASTTNQAAQIAALTSLSGDDTDVTLWTHIRDVQAAIGAQSLASIACQDISISIDNVLGTRHATGNAGIIDEPKRDGHRTVTLSVTLDYYKDDGHPTAAEWIDMYNLKTPFRFMINAYNNQLPAPDRAMTIMIPKAYPTGSIPRDISSAALTEAPLEFTCQMIDTAPTDFGTGDDVPLTPGVTVNPATAITEEIRIFVQNDQVAAWI